LFAAGYAHDHDEEGPSGDAVDDGYEDEEFDGVDVQEAERGAADGSCTATSSTSSKNSSKTPTKPTTSYDSAYTDYPSPNSPSYAASPPPWPPTTAPPNSNEASTSS
jgi:hypothetical protein